MILTFEQFIQYYKKHNRFPEGLYSNSNKVLNQKQLQTKYEKYIDTIEHKQEKHKQNIEKQIEKNRNKIIEVDEKWQEVKQIVWQRDQGKCRLYFILTEHEKLLVKDKLFGEFGKLDLAHILNRSTHPKLIYDPENIILMARFHHSLLDHYYDPVTEKPLNKEEHLNWWYRIVGKDHYNYLLNKK